MKHLSGGGREEKDCQKPHLRLRPPPHYSRRIGQPQPEEDQLAHKLRKNCWALLRLVGNVVPRKAAEKGAVRQERETGKSLSCD